MEYIECTGKTVEDAVQEACIKLSSTRENVVGVHTGVDVSYIPMYSIINADSVSSDSALFK